MTDFVTLDSVRYRIVDRFPVAYEQRETDAQRKARGDAPVRVVAYTSCRIERVRDDMGV
jgi:hypothetical protein